MRQAPNFSDISAMSDLLGALEDVESGASMQQMQHARQTGNVSGIPDDQRNTMAMANILTDLYAVAGEELNVKPTVMPNAQPPQQSIFDPYAGDDNGMSYEEYLAQANGQPLRVVDPLTGRSPAVQQPQYQTLQGDEWILVAEAYSGVKSLNTHSIKNAVTGSVILSGVTLKESATAICHMLNEGKSITDPKLLGVIASGVQYTYIVENMVKTLKQKSKVIRESNYDAAKQCDHTINDQKKRASDIKYDLLTYLTNNNISYK